MSQNTLHPVPDGHYGEAQEEAKGPPKLSQQGGERIK